MPAIGAAAYPLACLFMSPSIIKFIGASFPLHAIKPYTAHLQRDQVHIKRMAEAFFYILRTYRRRTTHSHMHTMKVKCTLIAEECKTITECDRKSYFSMLILIKFIHYWVVENEQSLLCTV